MDVVRAIMRQLKARGLIASGLSYGSAFSGVDLIAEAIDLELGGKFAYEFASESDAKLRGCLIHSWGARGLEEGRCHADACGEEAMAEAGVDLFALTASCRPFSRRNHRSTPEDRVEALTDVAAGLRYVSRAQPRLVLVENVAEPCATGPITGMLRRVPGYDLEMEEIDPRDVHVAVARARQYWLLRRR